MGGKGLRLGLKADRGIVLSEVKETGLCQAVLFLQTHPRMRSPEDDGSREDGGIGMVILEDRGTRG